MHHLLDFEHLKCAERFWLPAHLQTQQSICPRTNREQLVSALVQECFSDHFLLLLVLRKPRFKKKTLRMKIF